MRVNLCPLKPFKVEWKLWLEASMLLPPGSTRDDSNGTASLRLGVDDCGRRDLLYCRQGSAKNEGASFDMVLVYWIIMRANASRLLSSCLL